MKFLANPGNSMVIEMQSDKIRLSHGFHDCQLLAREADSQKGGSLATSLQYQYFHDEKFGSDIDKRYLYF